MQLYTADHIHVTIQSIKNTSCLEAIANYLGSTFNIMIRVNKPLSMQWLDDTETKVYRSERRVRIILN